MKQRTGHAMTSLLLLIALFLAGCTVSAAQEVVVTEVVEIGGEEIVVTQVISQTAAAPPPPTAPPQTPPPRLITLDVSIVGELPNLDPQQASSNDSFDLIENLFAGLSNFNQETQQVEPELAREWEISPDGRTWTFHLRDDIYWVQPNPAPEAANQPLTAEAIRPVVADDVVFAIQRACSRLTETPNAFVLFVIEGCQAINTLPEPTEEDLARIGIRALDPTTLEISLTHPASYFLTITTLPLFHAVPRELVEEQGDLWQTPAGTYGEGWQTPRHIITSGPFLPPPEGLAAETVRLYKNPLWPLPTKGNADVVTLQFVDETMASYEVWQDKMLDVSPLPPEAREDFMQRTPDKAKLVTNETVFYLGFNFDSAVFREPAARRAFSAAIDRQLLIEEMLDGRAQPLRHFTPPGVFGAPPVNEVGVGYSPDYARQQMANTGFRDCKLIPEITVLVSTADLSLLQGELLRDMWITELGCEEALIQFEQVSFGQLLARTTRQSEQRPDMFELAWPASFPDAHNVLTDLLHCNGGENRQNRPCAEEDSLLRQAGITPNVEERRGLYRQAESLFFGDTGTFPVIPLYVRGDYTVVQSWVDFTPARFGGEQYDTYVLDDETKQLERSRG